MYFREVPKEQKKQQDNTMEQKLVKLHENKGSLVKDAAEKEENVVFFGGKRRYLSTRSIKEKENWTEQRR